VLATESPYDAQQPDFAAALAELRAARRHKRLEDIHWVDAFYKVYLSAILGVVAIVAISSVVGGDKVRGHDLVEVIRRGPAFLGLVAALSFGIGLRSGSRGGPIALEAPDVRHVLMSPLDRGTALRAPSVRQLRFALFLGAVVGAAAGVFAHRRLGHNPIAMVVAGALYGAVTASLGVATGLVASGRRLSKWLGTLGALVIVGWSVADAADKVGHIHSPATFVGRIALWPLHFDAWSIIPIVVVAALAFFGLRGIAGLSVEAAERRTALVGQLRFAVTMQDLRTVLVLRRQLAMELPRERPWFGNRPRARRLRWPVWRRGWRGVLRWPATRLVRLVLLAAVAGFCMRAAWNGTVPLIVGAGLAMWLAALDGVESIAQETDHPSRRDSLPMVRGLLYLRETVVASIVMVVVAAVAAAVAAATGPSKTAFAVAAIAFVPAGLAAMAGAAVSVVAGAPKISTTGGLFQGIGPPEFSGMANVLRAAIPPGIAVIGTTPMLAARSAYHKGLPLYRPELFAVVGVLVVVLLAVAWLRLHERIHEWWVVVTEEAAAQQKQRREAADAARSRARNHEDD
jgi:hypothetical protein